MKLKLKLKSITKEMATPASGRDFEQGRSAGVTDARGQDHKGRPSVAGNENVHSSMRKRP